ncbi:3-oxoacyl-[acyl-carrier-protein] reductase FabG-like [Anticarsia gemmatalis]|uniref:3-oxoacyl-[acyl-carrier-protein] reductase FabG-like n=1 Tax=Anticarsia gemmatalis TaxID=129554 RepID=UPI003F76C668
MSFVNKVVLVTGAGSGIGEATAILFAKEGATVVIVDRNEETANKTAEKCKEFGNKVLVIKTNVTKDDEAKNAIETTIKTFGKLDVLINNAGIAKIVSILSGKIMESYDEVMNTNLRSVVLLTSLAAPYLVKTKGCIVNTCSVTGVAERTGSEYPIYAVSKAGIASFTRLSAIELAPSGVRVNAVSPGPVITNLLTNSGVEMTFDESPATTVLNRVSEPQEIADLIVYLASDKARSITGSNYVIDNGMSVV